MSFFQEKNLKLFLIVFILSLPFWWMANGLGGKLESFWFERELSQNSQIFTAQASQKIMEKQLSDLKNEKKAEEKFNNLDIKARAAISVEVDKEGIKRIIYQKDSKESLPIASLTKLMTALVVFGLDETYDFSQTIKMGEEAVSQEGGSKFGDLRVGEEFSVENLVHIMLIESNNDAAFALTQPVGERSFVDLMNLYGAEMGLEDTCFINPTGLDPDSPEGYKNLSTAEDLVELSRYILRKYPEIFEITKRNSYKVITPGGVYHHLISANTNELLDEVPGVVGGKTGWTPQAGGCLVLVLENPQNDNYFINVILGAEDRFGEMEKIIDVLIPNRN